jgi:ketosteroid isomerase-like protein
MTDHVANIRARRAQSNTAIAARDTDGTVALMLDDVIVAVAGGPTLNGRAASRTAFAAQFADPSFHGYVREPGQIILADPPMNATEMGNWVGTWGTGRQRHEMLGTYVAQWSYTAMGWFLQSEVFASEA